MKSPIIIHSMLSTVQIEKKVSLSVELNQHENRLIIFSSIDFIEIEWYLLTLCLFEVDGRTDN